jgi:hypothetical protein
MTNFCISMIQKHSYVFSLKKESFGVPRKEMRWHIEADSWLGILLQEQSGQSEASLKAPYMPAFKFQLSG